MAVELTKAQYEKKKKAILLKKVQEKAAIEKIVKIAKKNSAPATSAPTIEAAVRAAEAATLAAQAAKDMAVSVSADNKKFLTNMVEVIHGSQVIKMKINRNKKDQMTTVDLIRSTS